MLRPFWQSLTKFNPSFGLMLILLLGVPRFIIVLHANVTRNYNLIAVLFVIMWFTPLIFLTKAGRKNIGIKKPVNYYWLVFSFLAGAAICIGIYFVATLLYKHTTSNWFVYISRSYGALPATLTDSDRRIYFMIYAITAMTFSPIGEELFFRGLVHGSFVKRFGGQKASIADSAAFALTHLAHFGIVYTGSNWLFLPVPAFLWVSFMFIASRLFFIFKQKTGSILGAVICHASFNLTMTYLIFYKIL